MVAAQIPLTVAIAMKSNELAHVTNTDNSNTSKNNNDNIRDI